MKFGKNRHWSVRQTSVKVLSMIGLAASTTLMLSGCGDPTNVALQPLANEPTLITIEDTGEEAIYIPSTTETIKWGRLPNATDEPLLTVSSGSVLVFDTLSHEGLLEDSEHEKMFNDINDSFKKLAQHSLAPKSAKQR